MHTLYPVNYLIKTTPEITLGLHFDSFKLQQSVVEKSQILSVAFHLSATVNCLDGITLMGESTERRYTDELLQGEVKLFGHGDEDLRLRANFNRK